MTVSTVYPIVQALSRSEQIKLLNRLQNDIQLKDEKVLKINKKQQEKIDRLTWLKSKIFNPPK